MRVALCQINTVVGDLRGNITRILDGYQRAVDQGAVLVAFPELALTGYPPRDLLEQPDFLAATLRGAEQLVRASGKAGLVFGLPLANGTRLGKPLFNGVMLCAQGEVVARVHKKLLPTYDVFDEGRYFEADDTPAAPVDFGGVRWGLHVCEDAWNEEGFWERRLYDRDPVAELATAGAEVLLNVSASPFHGRKGPLRRRMFESHVQRHRLPLLYTNMVGGNDELIFDGDSFAFSADGSLAAAGTPFREEILVVDVSPPGVAGGERGPGGVVRGVSTGRPSGSDRSWEPVPVPRPLDELEAIHHALVLGLRDYARKCGFTSAVLGLSGGIDSALTAVLAAEALGPDSVWGVSLPSRFSSQGSLDDARALAGNLGLRYDVISIEPLFQASLDTLGPVFAGTEPGTAEENLQARARGNLLMALSNKFGHLLLTTGNKSEVATGYSTLYGDMAGGLAVISDVPKTTVYALSRWINREREIIPANTITKPPSAELKPDQTDQDSLPPYEILDAILDGYVERLLGHDDLVAAGFPEDVVTRVIGMISGAEYKRRQAPPGLRLSPKAFGMGRRMPIATPWPRPRALPEES